LKWLLEIKGVDLPFIWSEIALLKPQITPEAVEKGMD
jgi:hypothetical protein